MRCACFWNVDGDCIHKDTQNCSCGVEENVRQKAIEANNSAEVKPEVESAASREHNTASPKLPQFMDCVHEVEKVSVTGLSDSTISKLLVMYNFIERQLQA